MIGLVLGGWKAFELRGCDGERVKSEGTKAKQDTTRLKARQGNTRQERRGALPCDCSVLGFSFLSWVFSLVLFYHCLVLSCH